MGFLGHIREIMNIGSPVGVYDGQTMLGSCCGRCLAGVAAIGPRGEGKRPTSVCWKLLVSSGRVVGIRTIVPSGGKLTTVDGEFEEDVCQGDLPTERLHLH